MPVPADPGVGVQMSPVEITKGTHDFRGTEKVLSSALVEVILGVATEMLCADLWAANVADKLRNRLIETP